MTKIRRNISIDEEVWNLAKSKISEPLSCYIQKQLEIACRLDNDKAKIEKELHEKEQEITALRSQLCKLEKEDKLKKEAKGNLDKCMPTVLRIHGIDNVIGENQIIDVARAQGVDEKALIKLCKVKGLNVVELYGFAQEGKMKNGGTIR